MEQVSFSLSDPDPGSNKKNSKKSVIIINLLRILKYIWTSSMVILLFSNLFCLFQLQKAPLK